MSKHEEKLIAGLQDALSHARGEKTAGRVTRVTVPPSVDVKAIRERLHMSQQEFAIRYGFPIGTLRNWEQGRRQPEGAARLLLTIIDRRPEVVESIIQESAG